ncbi:unnamed protein product [Paramecium octaurelia]|uniref:Uncharacterized protein n=1 Tax=Paramecium octaurelia TaxID=43137 RepID=A0A8S1YJD3_PAROT|nr:unnamed protein product [Paramecium octaurelia]
MRQPVVRIFLSKQIGSSFKLGGTVSRLHGKQVKIEYMKILLKIQQLLKHTRYLSCRVQSFILEAGKIQIQEYQGMVDLILLNWLTLTLDCRNKPKKLLIKQNLRSIHKIHKTENNNQSSTLKDANGEKQDNPFVIDQIDQQEVALGLFTKQRLYLHQEIYSLSSFLQNECDILN